MARQVGARSQCYRQDFNFRSPRIQEYIVIGVMPYQLKYATIPCEVWIPESFAAASVDPQEKNGRTLNVLARLRDDIDVRAAESETLSIFQRLGEVDHRISGGETWVPSRSEERRVGKEGGERG